MRDSIDPLAPFDTRFDDFLNRLRKMDGSLDPAQGAQHIVIERALDQALEALTTSAEAQLRMIDAALARMVDGEYGFCEKCGSGIALERLEAMPATCLCGACDAQA
jgi:RNA polymerase-binding transcription factor DksA